MSINESPFVTQVTGVSGLDLDFEYDEEAQENLIEGSLKSSWQPGEPIILLVPIIPDIRTLRATVSDGSIRKKGYRVSRPKSESIEFYSDSREKELSYLPLGTAAISLYRVDSNSPAISQVGKILTAAEWQVPSIGTADYRVNFEVWEYTPPAGLELETEDDQHMVAAELFVERI